MMCGRYEGEASKQAYNVHSMYNVTGFTGLTESYSPVNQELIIVRFLNDVRVFNEEVAVLNLFGYFFLKFRKNEKERKER